MSFFQVLVTNVPSISSHSISESVEHFFKMNHSDHYLSHQVKKLNSLQLDKQHGDLLPLAISRGVNRTVPLQIPHYPYPSD